MRIIAIIIVFLSFFLHPDCFSQTKRLKANLYTVDGVNSNLADGAAVVFNNSFCICLDANDAEHFSNFAENLAFFRDGKALSVEARPEVLTPDTLFLLLTQTSTVKNYRFEILAQNLNGLNASCFLIDSFLNTTAPILLDGSISTVNFQVTENPASQNSRRFTIIFEAPVHTIKDGNWSDPTVWSNGKVPDGTTKVILSNSIIVDFDAEVFSVKLEGHSLIINPAVKLNVLGP